MSNESKHTPTGDFTLFTNGEKAGPSAFEEEAMTIQAADRYEDLLTEADELMRALRGALNAAATDVRPDWGHVGTMADGVVDNLDAALNAARALTSP